MALRLLILVLVADVFLVEGLLIAKVKTAQKAMEMLNFALGVKDIIESFSGGDSYNQLIDQDQLLLDLKAHIESAKTEILSSIVLRSKLDRIDDAVIAIQSSLTDIQHILEAESGVTELIRIFKDRFEEHDVIKHVRFLKTLLTYVSPGDTVDLISLVREGTRCGAMAFNSFRDYYLNLTIDGALLDIVYVTITTENVNIQTFVDQWVDVILEADQIFTDQIPICETRFPSDVQIDLENNDDPTELKTQLDQRYPDKKIDILFYSGIGTNQFHSFRYAGTQSRFFWARKTDKVNKILVVTDTAGKSIWDKDRTRDQIEECLDDVTVDSGDSRAAENVLTKIVTCNGLRYPIETAIVYFESDEFPTKSVTPNKDSPVVDVSKDDVTLKYCFKSGFMCLFSGDESTGRFQIRVYPNLENDVKEEDYLIGGSERISHATWFLAVAIFMMKHFI